MYTLNRFYPLMDTTNSVMMSSLPRRTPTKRSKANKRSPVKVVYISNPVKVSAATAAEFRALVQEFTGQDADSLPDPSRFRDPGSDDSDSVGGGGSAGGGQTDNNCETKNGEDENDGSTCDGMMMMPQAAEADKECKWEGQIGSAMEWFEAFDDDADVFTTQISAFYESPQADLQMLHAV